MSNTIQKVGFAIWTICIVLVVGLLATLTTQAETDRGAIPPVEPMLEGAPLNEITPELIPGKINEKEPISEILPATNPTIDANSNGTLAPTVKATPGAGEKTEEGAGTKSGGWADMFGALRTQEITIDGPSLTINLPDKGGAASVSITIGDKAAPLGKMISKLAFKKIHLKNGTFVIRTPTGFTQTIYAVNATLTGDKNSSVTTAKGRFNFRGEEVSFDISTAKPTDEASNGILPISVFLRGDNLNIQLAGDINLHDGLEIKGKLKLALGDLKFISAWLGYPLSKNSNTAKLDADGQFSWRGSVLSFSDAQFDIGDSEATGAISVDLADARPRLDATIAFDQVDTGKIFEARIRTSPRGARQNNQVDPSQNRAPPEEEKIKTTEDITDQYSRFALTYLNGFDADLRLSADRVIFSNMEALDCAITMTLRSGDLLLGLVESKIANGMVHGELALKNSPAGRVSSLRANLENIELERLAKLLDLPGLISGRAHIKLDLTGKGQGWSDITKTLSGEMKVEMQGPVQIGNGAKYLIYTPGDAAALKWWLDIRDGVQFRNYKSVLNFTNGMISAVLFGLRSKDVKIDGTGTIDIANRSGDLLLRRDRIEDTSDNDKSENEPSDNKPPSNDTSDKKSAGFDDQSADTVRIHGAWKKLFITPATSITPDKSKPMPQPPGRQGAETGNGENTVADPRQG